MKLLHWCLLAFLAAVVAAGAFVLTRAVLPAPVAAQPVAPAEAQPVVEWRQVSSAAVVVPAAGVYQVAAIGRDRSTADVGLRVRIRATQPVSFALVPAGALDQGVTHPRMLHTAPCAGSGALDLARECKVSEALGPWVLIVSDDRDTSAGAQIVAAAAAYAGIKGPAEALTAQNRVQADVAMLTCWEHCAGSVSGRHQ